MKTIELTRTLYRFSDGAITIARDDRSHCPNSDGKPSTNYEIVAAMAPMWQAAATALKKLDEMTSRQRSESGIYWKLKQSDEFYRCLDKLGYEIPKPFTATCRAEIVKDTYWRNRIVKHSFEWFCYGNKPRQGDFKLTIKAPYTREDIELLINFE